MWWVVLGVHVDVHGEWVMLWVAAMYNVLAITEHGRYGLSCLYAETVEPMSSVGTYGMYGIWSVWYVGVLNYAAKFYRC